MVRMQQALGTLGRAWSFRISTPTTVVFQTNRGRLGAPAAATKSSPSPAGRMRWRREEAGVVGLGFHSWGPIRAASSQEASSEMALEKKKCVPCETGKLQPMSEEKAQSLLPEVSGWELKEIDGVLQLQRNWKTKSFVKGLEIMKRVADVAEAEGHHPDLHLVNWNQLSINISTHAVGGLTENDFIVAAKIGALDLADLVRKPKAAAKQTLKPSST